VQGRVDTVLSIFAAAPCASPCQIFKSVAVRTWPPDRQLEGRSSK